MASPKRSLHSLVEVQCWVVETAQPHKVPPSGATQMLHPVTQGGKRTLSIVQPRTHEPPELQAPSAQQVSPPVHFEAVLQVSFSRHCAGVQVSTAVH